MIPVDAVIWREADVKRFGVSVESVLDAMMEQGARPSSSCSMPPGAIRMSAASARSPMGWPRSARRRTRWC